MRGRALGQLAIAAVVIGAAAQRARAQAPDAGGEVEVDMTEGAPKDVDEPIAKDPVVAKKWLVAAQTSMQLGDEAAARGNAADAKTKYENAAIAYDKAIKASDDITLRLPLALAQERAGAIPNAIDTLRRLIAAAGVRPELVKKAEARLDELSMKVAVITLTIVPDHAQVRVDGTPVGESPLPVPLVLSPGGHVLSLAAVGFQPLDMTLNVEAGLESQRKIVLEPAGNGAPRAGSGAKPVPPTMPAVSSGPLVIGGALTLALTMTSGFCGIAALSYHGRYEDSLDPDKRSDLASKGRAFALAADLMALGAIGAAVFTTYWYVKKYRPSKHVQVERHARTPKVDVVPWVQVEAGGLGAVGVF